MEEPWISNKSRNRAFWLDRGDGHAELETQLRQTLLLPRQRFAFFDKHGNDLQGKWNRLVERQLVVAEFDSIENPAGEIGLASQHASTTLLDPPARQPTASTVQQLKVTKPSTKQQSGSSLKGPTQPTAASKQPVPQFSILTAQKGPTQVAASKQTTPQTSLTTASNGQGTGKHADTSAATVQPVAPHLRRSSLTAAHAQAAKEFTSEVCRRTSCSDQRGIADTL